MSEADRSSVADAPERLPTRWWPYDDEVSTASPTGAQITLRLGEVDAQIAQVGASLRSLRIGGVDLVPPYSYDLPTPACSGVVLTPWPNRVRDGEWDDEGTTRRLAITEPKLRNASHGLLRFTAYEVAHTDSEAGTDFAECEAGYITVTPLQIDLTDFDTMAQVAEFWQGVGR